MWRHQKECFHVTVNVEGNYLNIKGTEMVCAFVVVWHVGLQCFVIPTDTQSTVVPPYPRVISSKTYRGCPKPRIVANPIYKSFFVYIHTYDKV
jgi:hypothetical protein